MFETYDWLTDQIAGRFPPILELQRDLAEAIRRFANAAFQNADVADPTEDIGGAQVRPTGPAVGL